MEKTQFVSSTVIGNIETLESISKVSQVVNKNKFFKWKLKFGKVFNLI